MTNNGDHGNHNGGERPDRPADAEQTGADEDSSAKEETLEEWAERMRDIPGGIPPVPEPPAGEKERARRIHDLGQRLRQQAKEQGLDWRFKDHGATQEQPENGGDGQNDDANDGGEGDEQ